MDRMKPSGEYSEIDEKSRNYGHRLANSYQILLNYSRTLSRTVTGVAAISILELIEYMLMVSRV